MEKITDTEKIEKIKTIFKEMLDVESMKGRKLSSKDEHEKFVHECSFDDISESLWKASCCIEKIALVVFEDGVGK
jgi:hypothetical protein